MLCSICFSLLATALIVQFDADLCSAGPAALQAEFWQAALVHNQVHTGCELMQLVTVMQT